METIPRKTVYGQMSGSKMQIRAQAAAPAIFLGRGAILRAVVAARAEGIRIRQGRPARPSVASPTDVCNSGMGTARPLLPKTVAWPLPQCIWNR